MESRQCVFLVCVFVAATVAVSTAFNPDRMPYKWSPIWFNSYNRRGPILHKRFFDAGIQGYDSLIGQDTNNLKFRPEPIMKWSPRYLYDVTSYAKRDSGKCRKENSVCAFMSENTGEPVMLQCCNGLECALAGGTTYTCIDPAMLGVIGDNVFDYGAK
ncbi:unnamed protein product [Meganyctiphanes norvegica]|uniref:Uncharacterized protein n=1 Tax=Meganyctiphanes norvegica TaxID=48144 RepID=A0AAV2PN63_MEGNR